MHVTTFETVQEMAANLDDINVKSCLRVKELRKQGRLDGSGS